MAIANTILQIKTSSANTNPATLTRGEFAYSYLSNTLYFGTVGGNGTMNIGGQFYTSQVDSATAANTASTLVKRDTNNGFFGTLYGNANTATNLLNSQNFSITGGDITATAVGFNGTGAVALNASLNTVTGLTAATYGSTTIVPVIQVAANGRIMAVSNATLSTATSFNISDTTTSNTINSGATVYFQKGGGVTTTVSANTVSFNTDNTILRSNTAGVGGQVISTDLTVAGNLVVSGAHTYINTATVQTAESLLFLAENNNVGDIVDIGFYGQSYTGGANSYHGLIREGSGGTSAGNFYLFKNLTTAPAGNTVNYASLTKASLVADLSLSTGYAQSSLSGLGTGVSTFLGTPSATNLAAAVTSITGTAGSLVFSNSPTLVSPTLGAASATSLALSSALTVPNGGTGAATFTTNGITYGNGTGAIQVTAAAGSADANVSNQIMTVNGSGVPTWTTTITCGTF